MRWKENIVFKAIRARRFEPYFCPNKVLWNKEKQIVKSYRKMRRERPSGVIFVEPTS